MLDASNGFVPGSPCSGGQSIIVVAPTSSYPHLSLNVIFNNTIKQSIPVVFNINKILYVETVSFNDQGTQGQQTATMIILNDTNRTKFLTTVSYADFFSILQPVQVASL